MTIAVSLPTFYLYYHPRDYPDHIVVRRWDITPDGHVHMATPPHLFETVEQARRMIPEGMVAVADPDPTVIEVWLPKALAEALATTPIPSGQTFVLHRGQQVTIEPVFDPKIRH